MDKMKIYFARPITGCAADEVFEYYADMAQTFSDIGAEVLQPMVGRGMLRGIDKIQSTGYDLVPCSSNHSILQRDLWMVEQSDIVFCDLSNAKAISIGCCMELAVGHWLRKHTIVVMQEEDVHCHAFVLEAADVIFKNLTEAIKYLEKLIKSTKGRISL